MRAGNLRHKISFQEQTNTSDGMLGFSITWANISGLGSVPASITAIKSNEIIESLKLELKITHKIKCRYHAGITAKHRILFGSRTFNIVSIINPGERNISLEFLAIEEV